MKKITLFFAVLISAISINAAPYLKGSFNNWEGNNPFNNGTTTVLLNGNSTYTFKIEDNGTWYGNNGTMDSGNCTNWVFEDDKNNAQIKTTITGNYVFTWNANEHKLSVTYPTESIVVDYYIAGTIIAAGWNEKGQIMTNNDGVYTYTCSDLTAGEYQFKITNGTWDVTFGYNSLAANYQGVTKGTGEDDNNIILNITETTNLTITFNGTTITLNLPEITTYTIAGNSKTLFGTEWNEKDTNNNLIEGENNIWSKTYTNVTLPAGEIEFKIIKNYNWETSFPKDFNAKLNIPTEDKYNVTFTFDTSTNYVNATAEEANDTTVALENTTINNIFAQNGMIIANEEIAIFTITGQNVTDMNGNLAKGVYIVKSTNSTVKVVVK